MSGELYLLAALLVLSAFFSSSETAFTSLDRVRLEHYQRAGQRGAGRVARLLAEPGRMLSAILLGNNLVNTGAAAVGTLIAAQLVGGEGQAALYATLGVTVLLMVFGEIGPKTVALHNNWALARAYAVPLSLWATMMRPVVSAFDLFGRALMRLIGGSEAEAHLSAGELRTAITMGAEAGALEEAQSGMMLGALRLQERPVSRIMVHRTEMVTVAADAPLDEVARTMAEHGIQRLPVYRDEADDIVGLVHISDVTSACISGALDRPAAEVMREIAFDSELASIAGVLERMKAAGRHMAVLTDEFGSIVGLVTLEDIVEEIVGQIRSESGSEAVEVEASHGDRMVVEGRKPLADLAEELEMTLAYPGVETVGGLVLALLGRFPRAGEQVIHAGLELTVLEADARRVRSVAVRRLGAT